MDLEFPQAPPEQISDSAPRKRALSASINHTPTGNKQPRTNSSKIPNNTFPPSPIMTPSIEEPLTPADAAGVNPPHHRQCDEDSHMGDPKLTERDDVATDISDLEIAQFRMQSNSRDPFVTPTPSPQPNQRNSLQKQATLNQTKGKQRTARLPIGHPNRPETRAPSNNGSSLPPSSNTNGEPLPTVPATPRANKEDPPPTSHGLPLQPGYMPNPTLLSQPLPTSENGVISIGDFKYTEYPRDIPHLYPQLSYHNLHHHQPQQIIDWNSKKGNKVLTRQFRAKYETEVEARRKTRDSTEETIAGFLGNVSFELSDPKVNALSTRNRIDPPWHTLIYNLSDADFVRLLAHPIIATPECVIIISPFHQVIPTFIASITGLTCRSNTSAGQKTATEAVRRGLMSSTPLANDFDHIAGAGAFQTLIDGLNVYFVNTSETHPNQGWWNAESSGMPRNISIEQYQALMSRIKKLTFPTDDYGDGMALQRTKECINCKCISHTAALCPLYRMKGWLGPSKEEFENRIRDSNPPQFPQNRGIRGRGSHSRGGRSTNRNMSRGPTRRG